MALCDLRRSMGALAVLRRRPAVMTVFAEFCACHECAVACLQCATACLKEPDPKAMARCVALDLECADICQLAVASIVISVGVGIGYAAMPALVLDASPPHEAGSAVGVNALSRSLGTTLAAALMGTVLTSSTVDLGGIGVPTEGAFQTCFVIGAAAAFLGVAIAALIPAAGGPPTEPPGHLDG